MDIQYNRNEGIRTVVTNTNNNGEPSQKHQEDTIGKETNDKETKSNLKISLNDDRYIENTVIFLPNVWSLMPTSIEYQKLVESYKYYIDNLTPSEQQKHQQNKNFQQKRQSSYSKSDSDSSKQSTRDEQNELKTEANQQETLSDETKQNVQSIDSSEQMTDSNIQTAEPDSNESVSNLLNDQSNEQDTPVGSGSNEASKSIKALYIFKIIFLFVLLYIFYYILNSNSEEISFIFIFFYPCILNEKTNQKEALFYF